MKVDEIRLLVITTFAYSLYSMGSVVSTMSADPPAVEGAGVFAAETPHHLPARPPEPTRSSSTGNRDIASLRAAAIKSAALKKSRPSSRNETSRVSGSNKPLELAGKKESQNGKEDGEISDEEQLLPASTADSISPHSSSPIPRHPEAQTPPVIRSTVVTIGGDNSDSSSSSSIHSTSTFVLDIACALTHLSLKGRRVTIPRDPTQSTPSRWHRPRSAGEEGRTFSIGHPRVPGDRCQQESTPRSVDAT